MPNEPTELTIEDLAERAGVSVRTVRYYIGQGLLAGPGTRGRAAAYGDEHLARLLLIRRLSEQHVPLAEQRQRLEGLSLAEVQSLLGAEQRRDLALQRAETARSPRDYVAELLARARGGRDERQLRARAPSQPPMSLEAPMAAAMPAPAPQPRRSITRPAATSPRQASGELLAEDWHRWQLAPGLELHARTDVASQHAQLIERLLETARQEPDRQPGSAAEFPFGGAPDAN